MLLLMMVDAMDISYNHQKHCHVFETKNKKYFNNFLRKKLERMESTIEGQKHTKLKRSFSR